MNVPEALLALVPRLADAARAAILPHYRSQLLVDDKLDASPVTIADRGAEKAMREILEAERPEDGIIGEEFGRVREEADWVWVLDPVDGTKSFVTGRPTFVTLIGLLYQGRPVMGVIDQPVLDERWIGVKGKATTLNGQLVRCAPTLGLARARLGSTGPQYFTEEGRPRFDALLTQCHFGLWGGDGYLYAQLATGGLDMVIEEGLKLHDFAALAPVVEGAGGRMTDWDGAPLTIHSEGRVLAAATASLHEQALGVLKYGR